MSLTLESNHSYTALVIRGHIWFTWFDAVWGSAEELHMVVDNGVAYVVVVFHSHLSFASKVTEASRISIVS